MPDPSFSKEIFPNIQSKPPLIQLEAIFSHPIASYLEEETNLLSNASKRSCCRCCNASAVLLVLAGFVVGKMLGLLVVQAIPLASITQEAETILLRTAVYPDLHERLGFER